jgi:hypothetical protein
MIDCVTTNVNCERIINFYEIVFRNLFSQAEKLSFIYLFVRK